MIDMAKDWLGQRVRLRGSDLKGEVIELSQQPNFVVVHFDSFTAPQPRVARHIETLIRLKKKKKNVFWVLKVNLIDQERMTKFKKGDKLVKVKVLKN